MPRLRIRCLCLCLCLCCACACACRSRNRDRRTASAAGVVADLQSPNTGMASPSAESTGDVVSVAAGQRHGERCAVPLDDQMVPAARPSPIDRRRPGVKAGPTDFNQQRLVQAGPHAGLGPVPHTAPAGHPAATDPLGRDVPPAHYLALAQHVDDARQGNAVVHRKPAGEAASPRRTGPGAAGLSAPTDHQEQDRQAPPQSLPDAVLDSLHYQPPHRTHSKTISYSAAWRCRESRTASSSAERRSAPAATLDAR